ncbi:hypothetical protein T4D_15839 [Trichinella pseudospiralis]|uniref:Uncharacterized protein n=1 Tax=Trichinella pseudospiralis TaxID=6337 RepID=A0A0V1FAG5_TRIPS|nr:hypothetical protein T4D_15839 [Trichinella pseudospiralis]
MRNQYEILNKGVLIVDEDDDDDDFDVGNKIIGIAEERLVIVEQFAYKSYPKAGYLTAVDTEALT